MRPREIYVIFLSLTKNIYVLASLINKKRTAARVSLVQLLIDKFNLFNSDVSLMQQSAPIFAINF